ncbi:DNA polymerase [Methylorubrum salsuginis]|uniref:DNA polymerase family A n=1 Tax=Methylorubrum salsuginis TaxID=414703 RepID=A0A1I4AHN6_9HYPH|nr:DNA polymerase [Methylorubrum salsuginis]SFK55527.1 DNA polymerase family A [Methylorubrum salsuginis]
MTDITWKIFIFLKDFTGKGADIFYWYDGEQLIDTNAQGVSDFQGIVVCHDFWIIRDEIYDKTGKLPNRIVDLDEFRISISGIPSDRLEREKNDVTAVLGQYGAEQDICLAYKQILNKIIPFDSAIVLKAAKALSKMYEKLIEQSDEADEKDRFFNIELPVYCLLQSSMTAGIAINKHLLSSMRAEAEHEYFSRLKAYSDRHNMPLETPSKSSLEAKLRLDGFEIDGVSIDYLLEYVPHQHDFGSDTIALQAADTARRVLGSLTLSTATLRPVIDVFGSRTSRIHLRSPSLQNIPKKYRSIITAHRDNKLSYVDFDQYEVGIMAALSDDAELLKLYEAGDMYDIFATEHLGLINNRKAAKQLFLSYAYGMSRKALIDAAVSLGADRTKAKNALGLFKQYEAWKKTIWSDFQEKNCIKTLLGNRHVRERSGALSSKEQRSSVSQVVQGTASLIFKQTLLDVGSIDDVKIVLPMHDALLFEHKLDETPTTVVRIFENTMTTLLNGRIKGKASVANFC